MDNRIYTEDSIQSISPREFTRLRSGVYCGSTEYSTQLVREVFSNALDEHNIGHGNVITILIDNKLNVYSVIDEGQGFPVNSKREDGETVLQAAFDVMNTSGKYSDDGVYGGSSLGLNGIGAKLTNFLSLYLEVETSDGNGQSEYIRFEDGIFKERKIRKTSKEHHGTSVTWSPDPQFFHNKEVNLSELKSYFEDVAALCPQLYIKLVVDGKETVYHSQNGLLDLILKKVKDKEILSNRFYCKRTDGDNLIDFCLTYTDNYTEDLTAYVNYGLTDGGTHITTLKSGITRVINKIAKDKGLLKDKDENLSGAELSEGLVIVFNLKANGVQYDAQAKTRVVDIDKTLINTVISNDFTFWLENNEKDLKIIVDRALIARKAREAAKKAKDAARNVGEKKPTTLNLPTKLVDCWSRNRSNCELLISEGDSAAGGLIGARDSEFQAVFPIRGKIINLYKNSNDKVFANQEVVNIIKALGLTLDSKTHRLEYDPKKLRYGKIIMCCDADADGLAIRNLLLTCFWSLCPELVLNGHIFAAIPPLFRITTKKNEYIFLKDAKALEEYKEEHKGEKFLVNRNKGLGEQDPDELEECLLNLKTRNVAQIQVNDKEKTEVLFETFMGESVGLRREYILKHSGEANG